MKAIVKRYEVEVVDKPYPAIPRGWVLVKVFSASWTPVEDAVALDAIWVESGRVLGVQGYGVVVDLGEAANPALSGKYVVGGRLPTPYGLRDYYNMLWARVYEVAPLPGLAYDGWLAEYAALPASLLTEVGRVDPVHAALATSAAIAWVAGRELAVNIEGEKVAIVGGGVTAYFAAYAAREFGREVPVYTVEPKWTSVAKKLGIEVRRLKELWVMAAANRGLDGVFVATLDQEQARIALEAVGVEGLALLHPVYAYVRPPPLVKGRVRLVSSFPGGAGLILLRKIGQEVLEEIAYVVEGGLEKPVLPRPKPYTVYIIESP